MPDSLQPTDKALLFFREEVEPTVAEFIADRANRRRGCLACLMLAHMTEHYAHARGENEHARAFKKDVRKENWAVGAIADVANAIKHVVRNSGHGKWSYTDVGVHQLNAAGIMRAGWPLGGHEVLVGLEREWRLADLIACAMDFWRQKLGLTSNR